MDSNFQYGEHRAMAPSHRFAAASHREAALGGAPASHVETAFRGAAGFREARRRHAVHVRLCHSRMLFVRAYPREIHEMVFEMAECGRLCVRPRSSPHP